jgi:hypothetical protein
MRFRFVLTHDIEGSIEISEMDGWKDVSLKLDRDADFHSLIEYFDGSFIFYGNNGVINGGIDFIKLIELNYGPDATLLIDIDLTFDDISFSNVFNGQFKLTELEEMPENKMRLPIIRDDFWAKFYSRLEQVVNIQSTTDLDDNAIAPAESIKINLPSQKIRYEGSYEWEESVTYPEELGIFGMMLDWEKVINDDLKKFNLSRLGFDIGSTSGIALNLIGLFDAPYDGDYNFDIAFSSAEYGGGNWFSALERYYVQKSYQTVQLAIDTFSQTNISFGADTIQLNTFNKTISLKKGDQIAIYGAKGAASDDITIFGTKRLNWITVDLATTGPIGLSGEQTIDGTLTSSSKVLVKDQADKSQNGVYTTGAGAWSRSTDADTAAELLDSAIFISGGTTNIDTAYRQTETSINLGVSNVSFTYTIPSDERLIPYPGPSVDNHLIITGDTIYTDTDCDAFLLHDVGAAITDRTIGDTDTFYSELLGSSFTKARQYDDDGCASAYGLAKGLHARRYSLFEKPYFSSFNQWWKGVDPILNLSLMYDVVDGQPVIRVEDKAFQYDDSEGTSVDFSFIRNITRKYDNDRIFNKIEQGYSKWQGEDISGIDDPQTRKIYSTRFKKIGKPIQNLSEFIAASLVWESARRLTREKSTDYKFDNETFILALNPAFTTPDDSPDTYVFNPELDEQFDSVTNLLHPETRYNIKLSVARNFLRWQNFYQGCLQSYLGSNFKFASGEGNFDMVSEMEFNECLNEDYSGDSLDEKGNIPVTGDYLHLSHLYEIEHPMDWDEYVLIRNNRRKPIGISQSGSGHVSMFIKTLEYKPVKGTFSAIVWAKEYLDLSVVGDHTPMQECQPLVDECERSLYDELGNILTDELGVCITE